MTTMIVTSSKSPHGNTRRVADALGEVLDARVLSPEQATPDVLAQADRIGFGSGIYWLNFDERLAACVRSLPDMTGHDAFVFATSGLPEPPFRRYTRTLGRVLEAKGFRVAGTFTCRGVDTWGPFKLFGGVGKGRPNDSDLTAARAFATQLAP
jgi:flavodoxin